MRLNFKRIGLLCGRAARACARVMGLTSARLDLLALLLRHELAQVEIAAILCVTEPVVSVLVRTLEEQGWLRRRRLENDRRFRMCSLTTEGRRKLEPYLNDQVNVDPDGQYSAQCMGEQFWLGCDWEDPLAKAGHQVRSVLEHYETELPLFRAMQTWNKRFNYDAFLVGGHGYGRAYWPSTFVENHAGPHRRSYARAEISVLRLNQFGEPLVTERLRHTSVPISNASNSQATSPPAT